MNIEFYTNEFLSNVNAFESLLKDVDKVQIHWKQDDSKWSLLEIICHLYDEEREDFGARLKLLLESPGTPFVKIDPVAWVNERKYSEQNYYAVLNKFINERNHTVDWLKSLKNPKWDNFYNHPKVGSVRANFILVNWVAHDYLHIRQIIRLKYDYLKHLSGESLDYAGNW